MTSLTKTIKRISIRRLHVYLQHNRTVIRATYLWIVLKWDNLPSEMLRDTGIVYPPSDISLLGSWSIRPPSILISSIRIQIPKYIYESTREKFWDFFSFDREKSYTFRIFFGSGNVTLCMTDIIISYDDQIFLFFRIQILYESIIKLQLVGKHFGAIGSTSSIGKIDIDDTRIAQTHFCHSAILVEHRMLEDTTGMLRELSSQDSSPRISRSCTSMPTDRITKRLNLCRTLSQKRLGLLETNDIRIQLLYRLDESLRDNTPDTVDVSREDTHTPNTTKKTKNLIYLL